MWGRELGGVGLDRVGRVRYVGKGVGWSGVRWGR